MPTNTTNQQITLPIGTDLADNPLAFNDQVADYENRLVQRYVSNADRTARNPAPNLGEMSIVTTNTWYDRWTGSKWLPCTPYSVFAQADQLVNNSTVLVNSAQLSLPLPTANSFYAVTVFARYSSNTTADIKFSLALPAGAISVFGGPFLDTAAGSATGSSFFGETITPATAGSGGSGGGVVVKLEASVQVAATTGNVTLQFAQNTLNASNTILHAFSHMTVTALQ